MAQIKRSDTRGVRRAVRAENRAVTARRARGQASGLIDGAMGLLPFTEDQWSRIWLTIIIGGGVALAVVIASLAGVPALAEAQIAKAATDAGFAVRHVKVTGTNRMDEREVYALALAQRSRAMPDVDIAALRTQLLTLPWVRDARVSRQLPDTLAIDIVEREPHAVLARPDRLMLIDRSGVELAPIAEAKAKGMLRISGSGAAMQVAQLEQLLAAAPALQPQVKAAEWVGNRRWNLVFRSDQLLALPEGEVEAATALVQFARLDGQNRLIGGKVAAFDMRTPPRIYMRVPGQSERAKALANLEKGSSQ
ncbi:FtsQ-type POTRA domain-containing protein [Erythrobacter sp. T5W1-R]|uniref:cell division protein FtsQ/DivIB n=1 Tax=Erythrobacter sp. T5W1-R TaxID=3101752 RepID=UPI002AFE5512|nr:FtsQ-type POTRA domain-containing protein [Erythrobacter sp. T5W1-R]MEA1617475.1 FtsQ-type POTRA domain-containing protein [Erythrobacter sp. T5W1-R]